MAATQPSRTGKFSIGSLILFVVVSAAGFWLLGLPFGGLGQTGLVPGCTAGLEELCSGLYVWILGGVGLVLALVCGLTLKKERALAVVAVVFAVIFVLVVGLPLLLVPLFAWIGPPR